MLICYPKVSLKVKRNAGNTNLCNEPKRRMQEGLKSSVIGNERTHNKSKADLRQKRSL